MQVDELLRDDSSVFNEVRATFPSPSRTVSALRRLMRHFPLSTTRRYPAMRGRGAPLPPAEAALHRLQRSAGCYIHFDSRAVVAGVRLPSLGVYAESLRLELEYEPGPGWSDLQVGAFLRLVRELRTAGGVVEAPWAAVVGRHP